MRVIFLYAQQSEVSYVHAKSSASFALYFWENILLFPDIPCFEILCFLLGIFAMLTLPLCIYSQPP